MRINKPVSGREVPIPEGELIASRTDLKGRITWVNDAFIAISGFDEQELLGQPHNIVRHPDMPPAAYEDMWRTLQSGKPWQGVVKNRCKNGDHYWVVANVTPVRSEGEVTGYLSVRTRPSEEQVAQAEALYRAVSDGKTPLRPPTGLMQSLRDWPLPVRLYALIGFLIFALVAGAIGGLAINARLTATLDRVYGEHAAAAVTVGRIQALMNGLRAEILLSLQHDPAMAFAQLHDHPLSLHIQNIERDRDLIDTLWAAYKAGGESRFAAPALALEQALQRLTREGLNPALQHLEAGEFNQANRVLLFQVNPLHNEARQHGIVLRESHEQAAAELYAEAKALSTAIIMAVVIAMALLILIVWFAARAIVGSVVGPLRQANQALEAIAEGQFDKKIEVHADDEIGRLLHALRSMQIRLNYDVAEMKQMATRALRVKSALDTTSNSVMVADADGEIIYCNRAIFEMFSKVESQMRQQMPGFSVAGLLGSNIDMYHRQPAHQRGMLANLKGEHRAEIEVGGRLFSLIANPIVNEQGERLGTVVEWRDRTQEAAVEQEVAQIIAMAGRGDFAQRLDTSRMEGFFLELSKGINGLLEAVELAVSDVARLFGRLAEGDLTQRIEADYEGLLGELKNDANQTIDTLESTLGRIMEASRSVSTAAQEIAHGNQDLSSRTEEQAASLEQTAASMEELTSTVKANAESAREARQMASLAADTAGKGSRSVQQMVGTMSEIEQAARKIVDIIAVIDGIAFQTNILALNAAVEAARAGEQGRGFAVVAGEVRSLAQRSAAAAKEIKALISDSVSKVEQGTTLAGQTGTVIAEVVDSVGRVAEVVADISAASAEQSSGIEQVNTAITHMDDVTQQNAALVEQASAAAESLEEQANVMVEAVSVFRMQSGGGMLGVGSQVSVPPARPAPARGVGSGAPVPAAAAKGRRKVAAPLPPVGADDDDWQDF